MQFFFSNQLHISKPTGPAEAVAITFQIDTTGSKCMPNSSVHDLCMVVLLPDQARKLMVELKKQFEPEGKTLMEVFAAEEQPKKEEKW